MNQLHIIYLNVEDLIAAELNARTHSKKQIKRLCRVIKELGFWVPILVDRDGRIIAGHGRVEAAKLAGLKQVPTIQVEDLSPEKVQLLALAENKLSESGGWDESVLQLVFGNLEGLDLGLDLTLSAFDVGEIDLLLGADDDPVEEGPSLPPARSRPAISRNGDLWLIGNHRLLCGNALDSSCYQTLMWHERAQMVFTDSPYNVAIDGHVSGNGATVHPEFAMASGEMSEDEFVAFLKSFMTHLVQWSAGGSIHFICMDHRHVGEVLEAAKGRYEYKNLCVWVKRNGGMGTLYRSQHEFVFVFKAGKEPHINNVELGRHGRNRTNVWRYAGANSFGPDRDAALAGHPTTKPVAMIADAMLDCSTRGSIILDVFAGSGTTLLAAEQTGRRGFGIELDPYYVDLACERLGLAAKATVIHAATGRSFDEIRAERAAALVGIVR